MCTAVLSVEPGLPVLLAGVRDELTDRAWIPPGRHWPQFGSLVGGQDLLAGGTWLAVSTAEPRAACVLNGIGQPALASTRRSRGELPLLAAVGQPLDRVALADLDPFRLITADAGGAIMQSWDGRELIERELGPGLHIVVNSGLASEPHLAAAAAAHAARTAAAQSGQPIPGPADGQIPRHAGGPIPGPAGEPIPGPAGEPIPGPADGPIPRPAGEPIPGPAGPRIAEQTQAERQAAPPPDGRAHEIARIAHFLARFGSAARPAPRPGPAVRDAWGEWFGLVNGDGLGTDDQRALIVRRNLPDGRNWGTTSVSLVALAPGWLRYDFTGQPGDPAAWQSVV